MKKIINFRAFFVLFLISICCIYCFAKANISALYLFVLILPILFFLYLIFKKKYVFLAISCIVLVFLSLYSFLFVKNYTDKSINHSYYIVKGEIYKINVINSNFSYFTVKNASGVDINGNSKDFNGNISVGVQTNDDIILLDVGDEILFETYLSSATFFDENNEVNAFNLKNDIKYVSNYVNISNLFYIKSNSTLLNDIKEYNRNLLFSQFGEEDGALAYALLYGDKAQVKTEDINSFKLSGIIHLFSVSGLHVSLIVAIVYFILKRLKLNLLLNVSICSTFLFLFCLLCSFTSSVVRASIMAIVFLLSKVLFKKNDTLNTLSFAGILLLILNPMNLFDGGFQMTFTAVFGILTFGDFFKRINIKNTKFKNLFLFISTTLCTQLSLIPLLAKFYGFLPTWALISNLIMIPLFSIFYPTLFIINLIVTILPFVNFLYLIPKALINLFMYFSAIVNLLPYSTISVARFGLTASICWYLFMFCSSKYLIVKNKTKIICCASLFILVIIFKILYIAV